MQKTMDFEIYTDGGYSMSKDIGAFAYVILQKGYEITRFADKITQETNNRAEIKAIFAAIEHLPTKSSAIIYSDSQYAIGVCSGKWKAKKNTDLVNSFLSLVKSKKLKLSYQWVKGHNGNKWNEVCDSLCNQAAGTDLNDYPKSEKAK